MATASLSTLPVAWVEQFRPGGRLVMDLQATLASGFLVVEKTREGKTSGSFLAEPLHFMPLQTERITVPSVQKTELLRQACQETFVLDHHAIFPDILFDPAFRGFLQWNLAGCQIGRYTQPQDDHSSVMQAIVIKDSAHNALVRFQKGPGATHWQGKVYGTPSLWQKLQQVYAVFLQVGEPGPQSYHLGVEQDAPFLLIGPLKLPLTRT